MTEPDHIESVLEELNLLQPNEVKTIVRRAAKSLFSIGVKDLITITGEARIKPSTEQRVDKFIELLHTPVRKDDDDAGFYAF